MPRPFDQTFNSLYRKKPFSDEDRENLRVFVEAMRREFTGPTASGIDLLTEADDVYDQIWIPTASGTDLDNWGAVLNNPRLPAEGDVAYRARLLAQMQLANNCLTVQAVTDCVNTIGATYTPAITVVRVHEYYKAHYGGAPQHYGRRADAPTGGSVAGDECLGEIHGLDDHDYLTFGIELNRTPSPTEAWELVNGAGANPGLNVIKAAQTRAHVITNMGLPNPPRYRMYSYAYSLGLAPLSWDDNFDRDIGAIPTDLYNVIVGVGGGWSYTGTDLFGDASANAALADVLVPRQDVTPIVINEKNIYLYAECVLASAGASATDLVGFAFRAQDLTDEFYAVVFEWTGTAWKYSIQYFNGGAWVVKKAPTFTYENMAVPAEVEIWVRDDTKFTVKINGSVKCDEFDVGNDIIIAGEAGFVTRGTLLDITVDSWRFW